MNLKGSQSLSSHGPKLLQVDNFSSSLNISAVGNSLQILLIMQGITTVLSGVKVTVLLYG